jgi:hypothetical protein
MKGGCGTVGVWREEEEEEGRSFLAIGRTSS